MKFSIALVAAGAALAAAQSIGSLVGQLPKCSIPCLAKYIPQAGCGLTDYACQCQTANKKKIQSLATSCVLSACGKQALQVLSISNSICALEAKMSGSASTPAASSPAASSPAASSPATTPMGSSTPAASSAAASTTPYSVYTASNAPSTFTGAAGPAATYAPMVGAGLAGLVALVL